jgi:hypothetical protein
VLNRKRDKLEPRSGRNGARGNSPVAVTSADHLRDIGTGWRFHRVAEVADL